MRMVRKTALDNLLDEYPGFLDRRPTSNHYKESAVDAVHLDEFNFNMYKVRLSRKINRPLKIWREQNIPHVYDIKYRINLEDIKRVKLYCQSNKTSPLELLQDSGELSEGINEYNNSYHDKTDLTIIPETFYFVEVEDYNGYIFQKGIPENPAILGDIYDHDQALDVWGVKLQIPRRRYKTAIDPDDYPNTVPPYFIDETEGDVDYENRMLEIIQDYQEHPLPSVEIKRILGVLPACTGRWRIVAAGEHVKDEEYNSAVYDFNTTLEDIPANINFGDGNDVQDIINRTMPCGKKGYLLLSTNEVMEQAILGLNDYVQFGLQLQNNPAMLLDYIRMEAEGKLDHGLFGLNDLIKWNLIQKFDSLGIYDTVKWTEIAQVLFHDTHTDFALDALTGCSIVGTGSAAYVRLNPSNLSQSDTPSAQSQSGSNWPWVNPANAVDADGNTYAYTEIETLGVDRPLVESTPSNPGVTVSTYGTGRDWNNLSELKTDTDEFIDTLFTFASNGTGWSKWAKIDFGTLFNQIPDGAVIKGVSIETNTSTSGDGPYELQINISNGDDFGTIHSKVVNTKINGVYQWKGILGGSGDLWGQSSNPAQWKNNLSAYVRMDNTVNGTNPFTYIKVKVYWDPDPWQSKNLNMTGLTFTVPSQSRVVGVKVVPKCYCETKDKVLYATITAGGVSKTKTATLPTTIGDINIGGGSDLWGGLPLTPSSYNSITLSFYTNTYNHVRLYYVTVYVYYRGQDGTIQTATITAPADGYKWSKLETDQNVPTQCGANALLYDILKASDNSVLLADQTPPVYLTDLPYQNIKVKGKLHTDNVDYYPSIDSLKVTALKNKIY